MRGKITLLVLFLVIIPVSFGLYQERRGRTDGCVGNDCADSSMTNPGESRSDCSDARQCVYSSSQACYAYGWNTAAPYAQPQDFIGSDGKNDHLCYADGTPLGAWEDCDHDQWSCGLCAPYAGGFFKGNCVGNACFMNGGETAPFGEYNPGNEADCCGDDANEYYSFNQYVNTGAQLTEPFGFMGAEDLTDKACCDSSTDCVYNGVCYPDTQYQDLFSNDGKKDYYCYTGRGQWLNVDYYIGYCTAVGGLWNVGEGEAGTNVESSYYTDMGGNANYCFIGAGGTPSYECCCGDDAGENGEYRLYHPNDEPAKSVLSDSSCCDNDDDCVYNDVCFASGTDQDGTFHVFAGAPAPNRGLYCWNDSSDGRWINMDYSIFVCQNAGGYNWGVGSGDANEEFLYAPIFSASTNFCTGAKNAGTGIASLDCCCGDDYGEYFKDYRVYADGACDDLNDPNCIDPTSNPSDHVACCDAEDCVGPDGNCYMAAGSGDIPHSTFDIDGDSRIDAFCENSVFSSPPNIPQWRDCDADKLTCELANICGYTNAWVPGEAGVGEYNNAGAVECCGDDPGENLKTRRGTTWGGYPNAANFNVATDGACCNDIEDCVFNGVCYEPDPSNNNGNWDRQWYPITDIAPNKGLSCSADGNPSDGQSGWFNVDYDQSGCQDAGFSWRVGGHGNNADVENNFNPTAGAMNNAYCQGSLAAGMLGQIVTESTHCCCGDDNGEFVSSVNEYANGICNDITVPECLGGITVPSDACCSSDSCVGLDHECVLTAGSGDIPHATEDWDSDGRIDGFCERSATTGNIALWRDCDTNSVTCQSGNICGYTNAWVTAEGAIGEYSNTIASECCGDDQGENFLYRLYYSQDKTEPDDVTDKRCCDEISDCVYDGICYTSGTGQEGKYYVIANAPGPNKGLYCWNDSGDSGDWINLDYSIYVCENNGYNWNVGTGDANIEQSYTPNLGGAGTNFCTDASNAVGGIDSIGCCCGDDDGEYYINTGGNTACCDDPLDVVDALGNCLDCSGGAEGDPLCCGLAGGVWANPWTGDITQNCCSDNVNEYAFGCVNLISGVGDLWLPEPDVCGMSTPLQACCDDPNDCVYNGTCYGTHNSTDLGIGPSGNDGTCLNMFNTWIDCDGLGQTECEDECGYNESWILTGETIFHGEYNDLLTPSCCGDDFNEFRKNRSIRVSQDPGEPINDWGNPLLDDPTDVACCNATNDCVYNGVCYESGWNGATPFAIPQDLIPDSNNNVDHLCYGSDPISGHGIWENCDQDIATCGLCAANVSPETRLYDNNRPCQGQDCYAVGGEEFTFGEYQDGNESDCCGDDDDEYLGTMVMWAEPPTAQTSLHAYIEMMGPSNPTDKVCCESKYSCVYNGSCYVGVVFTGSGGTCRGPAGSIPYETTNLGGACFAEDYNSDAVPDVSCCGYDIDGDGRRDANCNGDRWFDCDGDLGDCEEGCGYNYVPDGENDTLIKFGEYNKEVNKVEVPVGSGEYIYDYYDEHGTVVDGLSCCGDESDEWFNICEVTSSGIPSETVDDVCTGHETPVCCNMEEDCVFNATCISSVADRNGNEWTVMPPSPYSASLGLTNGHNSRDNDAFCNNSVWVDCDANEIGCGVYCNYSSWSWDKSGENITHGEYYDLTANSCCGDDKDEWSSVCQAFPLTSYPSFDAGEAGEICNPIKDNEACCEEIACVHNGTCYPSYKFNYTNSTTYSYSGETTSSADFNMFSTQPLEEPGTPIDKDGICYFRYWFDCDTINFFCEDGCGYTNRWLNSGEDVNAFPHGNYDNSFSYGCCGDDADEWLGSCAANDIGPNPDPLSLEDVVVCSVNNTNEVCCNNESDCSYNGTCFNSYDTSVNNITSDLGYKSTNTINNDGFCDNTVWFDCDTNQNGCEVYCGYTGLWIKGGESFPHGDYIDNLNDYCCGDDESEYDIECGDALVDDAYPFIDESLPESVCKTNNNVTCCDLSTDCVFNGTCYDSVSDTLPLIPGLNTSTNMGLYSTNDTENDGLCINFESLGFISWADCDIDKNACEYYCGYDGRWMSSGEIIDHGEYIFPTTLDNCCGDDPDEWHGFFKVFYDGCDDINENECEGINNDDTDLGCCNETTDCVIGGSCYTQYDVIDMDLDGAGVIDSFCNASKWFDCDTNASFCNGICGHNWTVGGELNPWSEYNDGSTTPECCGDDPGETFVYFKTSNFICNDIYENACANGGTNYSDYACCDAVDDCVFDRVCYSQGEYADVDFDGLIDAFCDIDGNWTDVDYNQPMCIGINHNWSLGGEREFFGEYNHSNQTVECCGDDPLEFYVNWTGFTACCNESTDCVGPDGICNPLAFETGKYCNDGIDNDCNNKTDCEDPNCYCGTPGPGNSICNGVGINDSTYDPSGGFYGNISIMNNTMEFGPWDFCSDLNNSNTPCLNGTTIRVNQIKCGDVRSNFGTSHYGVCDDTGVTTECQLLGVNNFDAEVIGDYNCNEKDVIKPNGIIRINITFDPLPYTWDYLVRCNLTTGNGTDVFSVELSNWSSSGRLELWYNISDPIFWPPLTYPPVKNRTVNFSCQAFTGYDYNNGWEVSGIVNFDATVAPVCDEECLINSIYMPYTTTNSSDYINGTLPCFYCNWTVNPYDWTVKGDGARCLHRLKFDKCESPEDNCSGLCCAGECTTPYTQGYTIDNPKADWNLSYGYWVGMACVYRERAGLLMCDGTQSMCDRILCADNDLTDDWPDVDLDFGSGGNYEYNPNALSCDQHSDCNATDPTLGCSPRCRCEKMPKCKISNNTYYNGELNPLNPCEICDINTTAWSWTNLSVGAPCGEWKCSNDVTFYENALGSGKYAVRGACIYNTTNQIECLNISAWSCADMDIEDFGMGTQILPCDAECDSIFDINASGNKCRCKDFDEISGICLDPCTWKPPCDGVNIAGVDYYCGKTDNVCPMDFKDPSTGLKAECNFTVESSCCDYDCNSSVCLP